jgi:hypothetical protein
MKNKLSRFKQLYSDLLGDSAQSRKGNKAIKLNSTGIRTGLVVFTPTIFFVALALAVILAPKLILFIFSSILLFFAICFGFVAYKFIQIKKQFNKVRSTVFAKGASPKDYRAQIFVEKAVNSKHFSSEVSTEHSLEDILESFEGQSDLKLKLEKIFSDTKLMTEDEEGNIIEIVEGKKILLH